jgi:hypothetical protein
MGLNPARHTEPSALWRKARAGELEDAAASTLVNAFELDFHGDLESGPRFTAAGGRPCGLRVAARDAVATWHATETATVPWHQSSQNSAHKSPDWLALGALPVL